MQSNSKLNRNLQERWANCDLRVEVEGGTAAGKKKKTWHFAFFYEGQVHTIYET